MFNRWGGGTHGKGGSRYNPGFNYDTSGQYYNMLTKSEQGVEEPSSRVLEAPIQELLRQEEEDDDPCHQRKCTSNEHCCDGHVCVDTQNSGGGDGGGGVDESGDSDDDIGDGGDGGDG